VNWTILITWFGLFLLRDLDHFNKARRNNHCWVVARLTEFEPVQAVLDAEKAGFRGLPIKKESILH